LQAFVTAKDATVVVRGLASILCQNVVVASFAGVLVQVPKCFPPKKGEESQKFLKLLLNNHICTARRSSMQLQKSVKHYNCNQHVVFDSIEEAQRLYWS
jgi:hypothetical protein